MVVEVHIVPQGTEPERIQEYGVGIFNDYPTKSSWKKAIKARKVLLNGVESSTARMVQPGDEIKLLGVSDMAPWEIFEMDLEVLYEDDFVAVVNKPPGIAVSGNQRRTLVFALPPNLEPSSQRDACSPKAVHRLDYATGGALLVGKTRSAVRSMSWQFEQREVEKIYFAIVLGELRERGVFDSPIDEKPSVSHFERVATVPSDRFGMLSLVKLKPETGRTHQLRIHLSEAGHPILGDRDYCNPDQLLKGKGLYLHSYSLSFVHPETKERMEVKAEPHKKFKKIFPFVPWRS